MGSVRLYHDFFSAALLALQKRHTRAHQVVEGIPMHHVLAAIHNMEVEPWLLFFQQFGAFTGVCAVFAAKYHKVAAASGRRASPITAWPARRGPRGHRGSRGPGVQ